MVQPPIPADLDPQRTSVDQVLLDTLDLLAALALGRVGDVATDDIQALAAEALACGSPLTPELRSLAEARAVADTVALDAAQVRLFISGRGGTPAPPYESCHVSGAGLKPVLGPQADVMRARLVAAGLEPRDAAANEPPDHLSIELGYLVLLLGGSDAGLDASADMMASREFAITVLPNWQRWAGRVAQAVHEDDPGEQFWLRMARLAVAALEAVAAHHDRTP